MTNSDLGLPLAFIILFLLFLLLKRLNKPLNNKNVRRWGEKKGVKYR